MCWALFREQEYMNRDDARGGEDIASSNCDVNNILDLPLELSISYLTESHPIKLIVTDHSIFCRSEWEKTTGQLSAQLCI